MADPESYPDAWCTRCGYNIRSLPSQSKCPECSAPVLGSPAERISPRVRRAARAYLAAVLVANISLALLAFEVIPFPRIVGNITSFVCLGLLALGLSWLAFVPKASQSTQLFNTVLLAVILAFSLLPLWALSAPIQ